MTPGIGCTGVGGRLPGRLVGLAALLLAGAFAGQGLLGSALVAGFQVEGVLFDVLDDVLLLHLPLEAAERTFDGLTLLNLHFCQV